MYYISYILFINFFFIFFFWELFIESSIPHGTTVENEILKTYFHVSYFWCNVWLFVWRYILKNACLWNFFFHFFPRNYAWRNRVQDYLSLWEYDVPLISTPSQYNIIPKNTDFRKKRNLDLFNQMQKLIIFFFSILFVYLFYSFFKKIFFTIS